MSVSLITGVAGQDGSYLAEHLLSKGYSVIGVTRRVSSGYRHSNIANILKNKNFTSNSTLNDLLNETAQGDTNLESAGISPVSLSESFTQGDSEPMNTEGMPESVANAVTRDYSDLMKAISKKK